MTDKCRKCGTPQYKLDVAEGFTREFAQRLAAAERENRVLRRALELADDIRPLCPILEQCRHYYSCNYCGEAAAYAIAESEEESKTK